MRDNDPSARPDPDTLLEQFDRAWAAGRPPRIEEYLSRVANPYLRRQWLEELVAIDLEYRWRIGTRAKDAGPPPNLGRLGVCPRLEAYLRAFPDLAGPAGLSAELIVEEYVTRRRWGDR